MDLIHYVVKDGVLDCSESQSYSNSQVSESNRENSTRETISRWMDRSRSDSVAIVERPRALRACQPLAFSPTAVNASSTSREQR